jgi:hypothetical protein
MGTSQSSAGPGAAVSLVPPWAEDEPAQPDDLTPDADDPQQGPEPTDPATDPGETTPQTQPADQPNTVPTPPALAPPRRFTATRRHLGSFATTGNTSSLRRGVGHYVSGGYGGSGTLSRRLASTPRTAGSLGRILDPTDATSGLDRTLLGGKSADEIMDAMVEATQPHDGTLDAESSREAIRNALSELLAEQNGVDLLNLTDAQREFVIERFVAHDVFRRFSLDVGKHILDKAPDATTGLARLKQARNYIRQTIAKTFRKLNDAGQAITSTNVKSIVTKALTDSLAVFEGYAT